MTGAGIDYSPPGSTVNRDPETGIRYGIIPLHKLGEFAPENFEAEYDACCPHCGEEIPEGFFFDIKKVGGFYGKCEHCESEFREDEQYPDEPSRNVCDDGETKAQLMSDGDAWFFKSPFFTRAAFCSPCAPGACYLTTPTEDGERAYCPGPDWFDEEPPFPIYSVATGERVNPWADELRAADDAERAEMEACAKLEEQNEVKS